MQGNTTLPNTRKIAFARKKSERISALRKLAMRWPACTRPWFGPRSQLPSHNTRNSCREVAAVVVIFYRLDGVPEKSSRLSCTKQKGHASGGDGGGGTAGVVAAPARAASAVVAGRREAGVKRRALRISAWMPPETSPQTGFRVQGSGFRGSGPSNRVQGFGSRIGFLSTSAFSTI